MLTVELPKVLFRNATFFVFEFGNLNDQTIIAQELLWSKVHTTTQIFFSISKVLFINPQPRVDYTMLDINIQINKSIFLFCYGGFVIKSYQENIWT